MLGLSRWSSKGGSYRTIQRLCYTVIPWEIMHWTLFIKCLLNRSDEYLICGDASMIGKSAKARKPAVRWACEALKESLGAEKPSPESPLFSSHLEKPMTPTPSGAR